MDIKIISEFKRGHRHYFDMDDEVLGKRQCSIEVDDPGLDGTDFAHPAYFRGQDRMACILTERLNKILDENNSLSDLQELRSNLLNFLKVKSS